MLSVLCSGKPGATVPDSWPGDLSTRINAAHPLQLTRPDLSVYLSSSPPPFCPLGREEDAEAIVKIINAAEKWVRVAVMDYFPATIYGTRTKFWPLIDNAIRRGEPPVG
jgi:phospholipase D3/4